MLEKGTLSEKGEASERAIHFQVCPQLCDTFWRLHAAVFMT